MASTKYAGSILTGISPRSPETIRLDRLVRDGRATEIELDAAFAADEVRLLGAQIGYFVVSPGQVGWRDLLRPIAEDFMGFGRREDIGSDRIGPFTRHPHRNTFFRTALVDEKIDCDGTELAARLMPITMRATDRAVAFVPGPYSFTRMVEDTYYNDPEQLAIDYARAIAKSEAALLKIGYSHILAIEPFVGPDQADGEFKGYDNFVKALSQMKQPGITLGVVFPNAEATAVIPLAERSSVDIVGIDAVYSSSFDFVTGKALLIGAVKAKSAEVESQERIRAIVQDVLSSSGHTGTWYSATTDRLYDTAFDVALGKIGALAQFSEAVHNE